jgi:hypothetical protein
MRAVQPVDPQDQENSKHVSASSRLLNSAIRRARLGQKDEARLLLELILKDEPCSEMAWLWYADTFEQPAERMQALEQLLAACPQSELGRQALQVLREQSAVTAPTAPPAPPIPETRPPQPSGRRRVAGAGGNWQVSLLLSLAVLALLFTAWSLGTSRAVLRQQHQALEWDYRFLRGQHDQLVEGYNELIERYYALYEADQRLAGEMQDLQGEQAALQGERDLLQEQRAGLQSDLLRLEGVYEALQEQYTGLAQEYGVLQHDYEGLTQEFGSFRSVAIAPPYIYTHARMVRLAFVASDQRVDTWEVPFEALEAHFERGLALRSSPQYLSLVNQDGERFRSLDVRPFVAPEVFAPVVGRLYEKHGGNEESFIAEVWHYVTQLSAYSTELKETPRFPLETLLAGGGDCEDTAILFASMIKAAPVDWQVSLVYMDSENIRRPRYADHVMVQVKTGRRSYLVETTSPKVMSPYSSVSGWFFEVTP